VSWLIRAMSLRSVSFGPGVPLPFRGWIEPQSVPPSREHPDGRKLVNQSFLVIQFRLQDFPFTVDCV